MKGRFKLFGSCVVERMTPDISRDRKVLTLKRGAMVLRKVHKNIPEEQNCLLCKYEVILENIMEPEFLINGKIN
jgi:hypothetical protein